MNDFREKIKEALEINRSSLDYEWLKQPTLYQMWSEELAKADSERYRAKERLDLISAEIDSEIRLNPKHFGLERATDSAIKSRILLDERYKQANEEVVKTRENYAVISGILEALQHKKAALGDCVRMMLAGYFSSPNIPKEERDRYGEEVTKEISKGLSNIPRLKRWQCDVGTT